MLPWTQPAAAVALATFFVFLSFSRRRPLSAVLLIPMSTSWMVAGTAFWTFLTMSTVWEGGEEIFRFGLEPLPPALIFYGSWLFFGVMVISAPVVFITHKRHSIRQRLAYVLGALSVSVPLALLAMSPVRLQRLLDELAAGGP